MGARHDARLMRGTLKLAGDGLALFKSNNGEVVFPVRVETIKRAFLSEPDAAR